MKNKFSRFSLGSLALIILLVASATRLVGATPLTRTLPEGYEVVRVTNPNNDVGEVDGLLTPDMPDYDESFARGQSYAWSAIEYGEDIYIGTVYNPISGIFYRTVSSALQQLGFTATHAAKVTDSFIKLMYDDHFLPYESATVPVIVKIDKKTWDVEIVEVYAPSQEMGSVAGFRNVVEFEGKLYFAAMSFPSSTLVEIDPALDTSRVAFQLQNTDPRSSGGIRGLSVYNGEIIMSMANHDGIKIVKSATPWDSDSWLENIIADQETFNDLPAFYNTDTINGGAI